MRSKLWSAVAVFGMACTLAGCSKPVSSTVKCPAIFSDHMVLQQGVPSRIWGWAPSGTTVTVNLDNQEGSAVSSEGGWQILLAPMESGGPHVMTVGNGSTKLTFADVLVGEVWVCSGQSNMEWPVGSSNDAAREIAAADYPNLRLFTVDKATSSEPLEELTGQWQVCTPETIKDFTAVGYFFGRGLLKSGVSPVGLIDSTWGGTPVEAWTSRPALKALPAAAPILTRDRQADPASKDLKKKYARYFTHEKRSDDDVFADTTYVEKGWAGVTANSAGWEPADLPENWESAGLQVDGVVWYRREVTLPADWAGQSLTLNLTAIDDFDQTFFNGQAVGKTYKETQNSWQQPRNYTVPGPLVKAGRNVIAVRIFDNNGGGGFAPSKDPMQIAPAQGGDPIDLRGTWQYRIEVVTAVGTSSGEANRPAFLYNAMIAPIVKYGIKGAIWYQGESNAGRAYQYRDLFPTLIKDWRQAWGLGDFPFYFVQLANFMQKRDQPVDSNWAELREAQSMTLTLPHTGQAVIIDVGEANDIHPRDKQTVGHRLSVIARARDYGQDVPFSGPVYQGHTVEGNAIRLTFGHTQGGLHAHDGVLRDFAVAGADRKFVWAEARIDGDTIVVHAPAVPEPVAVRYAWADNPACTLYNGAHLPASPFRTDDWPGMTVNSQ